MRQGFVFTYFTTVFLHLGFLDKTQRPGLDFQAQPLGYSTMCFHSSRLRPRETGTHPLPILAHQWLQNSTTETSVRVGVTASDNSSRFRKKRCYESLRIDGLTNREVHLRSP